MNLSECILTLKNHEQRAACENALMECQSSSTKSYASSNEHTVQCDDIQKIYILIIYIVMNLRSVFELRINQSEEQNEFWPDKISQLEQ